METVRGMIEIIVVSLIIILLASSAMATVFMVGKPREPVSNIVAVISLMISLLMIAGVWYLYSV